MLSDDQLRSLISAGESSSVEFKTRIIRPDVLAKLITGFANAEGGYILVGVDERSGIVGVSSQEMMRLYDAAIQQLRDASSSSMYFHPLDGREVAVIRVTKASRVVSARDGIYVRRGASTVAMSLDELRTRFEPQARDPQIDQILEIVTELSRSNADLRLEVVSANSLGSKMKDYLIGGVIGAIISAGIALLVK